MALEVLPGSFLRCSTALKARAAHLGHKPALLDVRAFLIQAAHGGKGGGETAQVLRLREGQCGLRGVPQHRANHKGVAYAHLRRSLERQARDGLHAHARARAVELPGTSVDNRYLHNVFSKGP